MIVDSHNFAENEMHRISAVFATILARCPALTIARCWHFLWASNSRRPPRTVYMMAEHSHFDMSSATAAASSAPLRKKQPFPLDLFYHVFPYLSEKSLFSLLATNFRFFALLQQPKCWHHIRTPSYKTFYYNPSTHLYSTTATDHDTDTRNVKLFTLMFYEQDYVNYSTMAGRLSMIPHVPLSVDELIALSPYQLTVWPTSLIARLLTASHAACPIMIARIDNWCVLTCLHNILQSFVKLYDERSLSTSTRSSTSSLSSACSAPTDVTASASPNAIMQWKGEYETSFFSYLSQHFPRGKSDDTMWSVAGNAFKACCNWYCS